MSARRFPRDVPRAVQAAVRAALELVDDAGEVVGGLPALQVALGHDSASATRRVVGEAEALGYMRRVGPIGHGERRVFVVEARLKSGGVCGVPGCDRPAVGKWCPTCRQVRREDRAWWARAVEMCVAGESPPAISSTLKQPLWPDDDSNGVVFHLWSECPALLGDDWKAALREQAPHLFSNDRGRATARARDRRYRRRESSSVDDISS